MSIETAVFAVQRGGTTFKCKGSDLLEKLTDGDILLVNRGGVDYQFQLKGIPWEKYTIRFHFIVPNGSIIKIHGVNVHAFDYANKQEVSLPNRNPTLGEGEWIICNDYQLNFRGSIGDFVIGPETYIGPYDQSDALDSLFKECSGFTGEGVENMDVSNVQSMLEWFRHIDVFDGDVTGWDVGNVKSMSYMFNGNKYFDQDIGCWDVSACSKMVAMFYSARAFNQDLSRWCVRYVPSRQTDFDAITPSWSSSNKPKWGTCPSPRPDCGATSKEASS